MKNMAAKKAKIANRKRKKTPKKTANTNSNRNAKIPDTAITKPLAMPE